jgi:copper(I)-binding protein
MLPSFFRGREVAEQTMYGNGQNGFSFNRLIFHHDWRSAMTQAKQSKLGKLTKKLAGMVAVACWVAAPLAQAEGIVTISDPWVRATVSGQQATGAFMKITAHQPVRLVAGFSPVAPVVEIHEMKMVGDRMQMRALADGLPIAAGETAELKPGGYHVMLINLPKPIEVGQKVPLTLVFTDSSGQRHEVAVEAPARPLGQMGRAAKMPEGQHGPHHHGHAH